MALRDIDIKVGNDILQRIADLGNWLTYKESLAVKDSYNAVVGLFSVFERVLIRTFGSSEIETHGGCPPYKKNVKDFINWEKCGVELAWDYRVYVGSRRNLEVADDEKETLFDGGDRIAGFVEAVMNMSVTVPEKDGD